MTHLKRLSRAAVLLTVLLPLMAAAATAQEATVGYLDPDPMVPALPEYAGVQKQLRDLQASNQNELQARADAFQAQVEEFQQQANTLSEEARASRAQELQKLQSELQTFAEAKEQELGAKQAELMSPLLEKVQKAIDAVAEEKNLDLVLRLPALLYAKDGKVINITVEVAEKLGLAVNPSASQSSQGS